MYGPSQGRVSLEYAVPSIFNLGTRTYTHAPRCSRRSLLSCFASASTASWCRAALLATSAMSARCCPWIRLLLALYTPPRCPASPSAPPASHIGVCPVALVDRILCAVIAACRCAGQSARRSHIRRSSAIRSLFSRSTMPLACGLYGVVYSNLMPIAFRCEDVSASTNSGPLSMWMAAGFPWTSIHARFNALNTSFAFLFINGAAAENLVAWSTMTSAATWPCGDGGKDNKSNDTKSLNLAAFRIAPFGVGVRRSAASWHCWQLLIASIILIRSFDHR